MYPQGFLPTPCHHLQLRQLDEFLDYLKRHRVKEVFWYVMKIRLQEGEIWLQPTKFKPGIHCAFQVSAKDRDVTVTCGEPLSTVFKKSDLKAVESEAEKIRRRIKRRGFLLVEGSLMPMSVNEAFDVEEILNASQTPSPQDFSENNA